MDSGLDLVVIYRKSVRWFAGISLLILLLGVNPPAEAQGIRWRNLSLEDAMKVAEKEGKLVFVDTYTDWCKPCKRMMKEIFSLAIVGRWFNTQFVNIRLNMEKGWGVPVKEAYNIKFYPTYLFINPKGEVVHKFAGYQEERVFLFESEKSLLRGMGLRDMTAEYEEGNRDPEFLNKYFQARSLAMDLNFEEVADYLNGLSKSEFDKRDNMRMIYQYVVHKNNDHLDFDDPAFRHFKDNEDRYKRYFDEEEVEYRIVYVTLRKVGEAIRTGNRTEFERAITALDRWEDRPFLQSRNDAGEVQGTIQTFAMTLPLRLTFFYQVGDMREFEKTELAYLEKIRHKPVQLNQLAGMYYDWFDEEMQLIKAELWTRAAIELDSRRPDFYNTLAFIQFKKGDVDAARQSLETGIAMAKRLGDDYSQAQKLLSEVKQYQALRAESP